jgi:adenylylsulfate kinase
LYQKARQGLVKDFTGVSAPYEMPTNPALVLDTVLTSKEDAINALMQFILAP